MPPSLPLLSALFSLLVSANGRNLMVDYFMTSESQYVSSRCCKADNDILVIYPESSSGNSSLYIFNFTINRNLLRYIREKVLCSAELRLFQHGHLSKNPQRIELLLRDKHVLDSKKFRHAARGWKNFDVLDAFISNTQDVHVPNTRQVMFTFHLRAHELDQREGLSAIFNSEVVGEHKPRLFLQTCRHTKRKANYFLDNFHSPPAPVNQPIWEVEEEKCSVRLLYLQFEKDMSIPAIKAPLGVYVNYCAGSCPYLWKTKNPPLHTLILGQYSEQLQEPRYQPCCVPDTYEAAEAITVDNQMINFPNLRVTSCKCI